MPFYFTVFCITYKQEVKDKLRHANNIISNIIINNINILNNIPFHICYLPYIVFMRFTVLIITFQDRF